MQSKYRFNLFVFILILLSSTFAQTKLDEIMQNPGRFDGEAVTLEGTVIRYVASPTSTNYYLLQSDYGAVIKVNTAEGAPETYGKYRVKGIVYIDAQTRQAFLSEKSRTKTGTASEQETTSKPTTQQRTQPPIQEQPPVVKESSDNTMIYILVGGIVVILGILIFVMTKKKEEPAFASSQASAPAPSYGGGMQSTEVSESSFSSMPTQKIETTQDSFKTIKITTSAPKTLKFIPGKLVITAGDDKGKEFKIAGYPTSEGSIVSIGREEIKGERAHSHIQLLQPTISRKQAEIISVSGKLYVRNMSETNLTQVDGIEVQPNQKVELKNGATIRTGEVEFQYKV
ncbi:MAG TPA: FHA domain-containing protein [Ignavibacteria bacterium]|nr:FHA domain-containing protein [Ignavibacteria bacterium]